MEVLKYKFDYSNYIFQDFRRLVFYNLLIEDQLNSNLYNQIYRELKFFSIDVFSFENYLKFSDYIENNKIWDGINWTGRIIIANHSDELIKTKKVIKNNIESFYLNKHSSENLLKLKSVINRYDIVFGKVGMHIYGFLYLDKDLFTDYNFKIERTNRYNLQHDNILELSCSINFFPITNKPSIRFRIFIIRKEGIKTLNTESKYGIVPPHLLVSSKIIEEAAIKNVIATLNSVTASSYENIVRNWQCSQMISNHI